MTAWAAGISIVVALLALNDWRRGLLAVLAIALLQDIFRKLTPGAPSYFLLWAVAAYALVVLFAFGVRALPRLSVLFLNDARTRFCFVVFITIVTLQLFHSLLRYGNPAIPVLGGLFYVGPGLAMLTAVGFVDSEQRLRHFLLAYLAVFLPAGLTVYLSPSYADAIPVLRDVGTFTGQPLRIFDVGRVLDSHPGLMRTGEIAAWHAATSVVFLSVLALQSRSAWVRILNVALSLLLVGAIILTGRRKMLVALTIFFALQWGLLVWYRWRLRRIAATLLSLGLLAWLGMVTLQPESETADYLARSQTAYSSIGDRLETTLQLAASAVSRSKGVGLGAGSTSQGARYVGGVGADAGGTAEAGLGKIIVELGVPGLAALVLLLTAGATAIMRQLPRVRELRGNFLNYDVSFIAFLLSNLAAFAVASQLFGDFFVLIVVGTVAGFVVRIHGAVPGSARARP